MATTSPELTVLNLGEPDIGTTEVLRQARNFYNAPTIMLSAQDREEDKIAALDADADDYAEKPFGIGELLARLRVALPSYPSRSKRDVHH